MSGSVHAQKASSNVIPLVDTTLAHTMTDDECIERLASALGKHDETRLEDLAVLISRLAVPIEL